MNDELTLLLADDHPLIRKGLALVLANEPDIRVVAEADNGTAALDLIRKLRPQVAIVDLQMPQLDGLEIARKVRDQNLPTRIILLTMHNEEDIVHDALAAGINGYVLKENAVVEVMSCIRAVAAGKPYFSPGLSAQLLGWAQRREMLVRSQPGVNDLTSSERRILQLIAEYRTNKEIAQALALSPRTVENHRANICSKLDLRGVHALSRFAIGNRHAIC